MTPELTILLYSTILTFVLILVAATIGIREYGAMTLAGSRDGLAEGSELLKRAIRLRQNMLENMTLFAILVIIAHLTGTTSDMTVLGAEMFFFARIGHAVIYLAGWPVIRPLVWLVSLAGMGMIALELL